MRHKVDWTPQIVSRFDALTRDKDLSYQEVAKILSREFSVRLTKNACIGKARRMQKGLRAKPRKPPKRKWRPTKREPVQKLRPKPKAPGLIALMDLQTHHCRWPIGDRSPFLFCGEQKEGEYPYCTKHCNMAFNSRRFA
jgi:hypothetical protein